MANAATIIPESKNKNSNVLSRNFTPLKIIFFIVKPLL
jgi:hypothetical protein